MDLNSHKYAENILALIHFGVWTPIHKPQVSRKDLGQLPDILTEQAWLLTHMYLKLF